jgi:hypothetical protein
VLQFLFRDKARRFAVELSQQAYLTDIALLSALALATELERSNHLLTQWGHAMPPFLVARCVCLDKEGQRKRKGVSKGDVGKRKCLPRQRLT